MQFVGAIENLDENNISTRDPGARLFLADNIRPKLTIQYSESMQARDHCTEEIQSRVVVSRFFFTESEREIK